MQKCVNNDCSYYKQSGKCASVCVRNGYAHHITNHDHLKDLDIEELAMVMAEKILENTPTIKNKIQAVCTKMALYDKCLRWLDSEWEDKREGK